ncbi:hypothetical protein [Bordetella genomosp. 9]|uniref:hypothetical protein n=1 Tax=Bordetella genomosp. 9 TaxID=1416803 RepID=UPI0018DFC2F0|nr:hypothetical protein [Bordetella genomosp. 9]
MITPTKGVGAGEELELAVISGLKVDPAASEEMQSGRENPRFYPAWRAAPYPRTGTG